VLARFRDASGQEHWVEVKIRDSVEVREGRRVVIFIHELKGVEVEEVDPAKVLEWLKAGREALDRFLSDSNGKVWYNQAVFGLRQHLPEGVAPEDIIRLLCESGEYTQKEGWILYNRGVRDGATQG